MAATDWVEFEEERHQVAGLDGALVRLRSEAGRMQTIMLTVLLADPSFRAAVEPPSATAKDGGSGFDPAGALVGVDEAVKQAALALEAHLLEAMTGYRGGDALQPEAGEPRPQFVRPGR
ncbi:hypothetical protein GCM10009864_25180 [Streptomyces lunalinharesii]|uniref:Uncharacterized protein n=1 Tax=Streptomyces lunalinharesii TaxID=333384 RepID=A0ABN3RPI7_9ACTN